MAAGATIHTFDVSLSDMDRGVYEELALRVARHPSETEEYLLTRLLAYCLEYVEGIDFTAGISSVDEPAILVKDLTGTVLSWIEVGSPDASRLHFGSKLADRAVVYTHRDPARVLATWAGQRIHRSEAIELHSFDPSFITDAVAAIERRNTMTLTRTEGQLYLDLNGTNLSTEVQSTPIG